MGEEFFIEGTFMQTTLKNQLIELGFNESEAGAYAVLAEHSPASAAFIAKKLGQSRSTVYTSLDRLIAKGLVGTTFKNEIKQFIAEPASAIEDLLRREQKEVDRKFALFEGLAERLKMLSGGDAHIPNIIFFEGGDSLKKIYLGMLRTAPKGSTMRVVRDEFKWEKEWSFLLQEEWKVKVRRLRTENDIGTRLLINDSPEERKHVAYYRGRKRLEFRFLPKKSPITKFIIYILGDTVSILSLEKNHPVGLRIVNHHIAKNFEQLFDTMWSGAKR